MSFIRLRLRLDDDDVAADDLVAAVEAARLPLRGPSGRIYVLHDDGVVTQHPTAAQAWFALSKKPGSELLTWLVEGSAVATRLAREETWLVCHFDLEGAAAHEQHAAARAIDLLMIIFEDEGRSVDVEASLVDVGS